MLIVCKILQILRFNNVVMNIPKVCIIMPVYNGARTLRYALASLIRQTYKNWLCIIVNDGSTDGTKQILDSLIDERFQVYHLEKNQGRGIARDEALKHVDGKYLAYLDADDMLHEDKLRLQVEFLESHPEIKMVGCGCVLCSKELEIVGVSNIFDLKGSAIYQYGQALPLSMPSIMARLDSAINFHYNHFLDVGEDFEYFSRYCDGGKYANIPNALYYYLIGNSSCGKILYYQWSSMRVGFVLMRNRVILMGIKWLLWRFLKFIVYMVILPIFGIKRVMKLREMQVKPTLSHIKEYKFQLDSIFKSCNNSLL